MGELTTDDGIPVSELALSGRRSNWVMELLTLFNSKVLSRIVNRMAFTIAWSIAVTTTIAISARYPDVGLDFFTDFEIPGWPHELVGGFLAILLVFRTDQAYERFWEGRRQWADLSSACRDMGRVSMANLQGPMVDELMAHIACFPVVLKQHLRGTKNRDEIAAVFNTYLQANSSYIDMVTESQSMPSTLLLSMSNVISALRRAPRARQLDLVWQQMETKINALSDIVAECEKIKCSPLPLSYSRHTSRFFSIFTLTLPFAVVKDTTPVLVPGIVAFVSWVLFVTEEIGHVIEEPFGNGMVEDDALEETAELESRINDVDVKRLFQSIDKDGSGRIDSFEILAVLPEVLGMDISDEDKAILASRVMSKMDLDGDGYVDYAEFRLAWTFATGATRVELKQLEGLPLAMYCDAIFRELLFHWQLTNRYWPKELEAENDVSSSADGYRLAESNTAKKKRLFDSIDKDKSGGIELQELEGALMDLGIGDARMKILFENMDTDNDGIVDFAEFLAALEVSDVVQWLEGRGLGQYRQAFSENDIDGSVLMKLENEDLIAMGITSVGKRKSILSQVKQFQLQATQKSSIAYNDVMPASSESNQDAQDTEGSSRGGMRTAFKRMLLGGE